MSVGAGTGETDTNRCRHNEPGDALDTEAVLGGDELCGQLNDMAEELQIFLSSCKLAASHRCSG